MCKYCNLLGTTLVHKDNIRKRNFSRSASPVKEARLIEKDQGQRFFCVRLRPRSFVCSGVAKLTAPFQNSLVTSTRSCSSASQMSFPDHTRLPSRSLIRSIMRTRAAWTVESSTPSCWISRCRWYMWLSILKIRGKGVECGVSESRSKSRMESPDFRCEGLAADAAGGGLGLEVEVVEAAVEIPAGETTEVSRSEEADDVDSDTLPITSPSEEESVDKGISTTPGDMS